jgi:hypothetical protein
MFGQRSSLYDMSLLSIYRLGIAASRVRTTFAKLNLKLILVATALGGVGFAHGPNSAVWTFAWTGLMVLSLAIDSEKSNHITMTRNSAIKIKEWWEEITKPSPWAQRTGGMTITPRSRASLSLRRQEAVLTPSRCTLMLKVSREFPGQNKPHHHRTDRLLPRSAIQFLLYRR